ncbi:glycine-rich domain-containing protein [Azospirillum palustre]
MANLEYVKNYDFSRVIAHMVRDGLSQEEAAESADHLRAFMVLNAMHLDSPTCLVAWEGMEPAWHAFILDTRAYASFCERAFGRMLHHWPDAYGTDEFRAGWSKTVELAAKNFGIFLDRDPEAREASRGKQWNMAALCNRPLEQGEDPEDPIIRQVA